MMTTETEIRPFELPDLETLCPDCKGKGGFSDNPPFDFVECIECGGAGHIPTESGKKVLALMRHNIGQMAEKLKFRVNG